MSKIQTPWQRTKARFIKNKPAVFGLAFSLFVFLVAILGYLIMPDATPSANRMQVQLSAKKPGYEATFLRIKKNQNVKQVSLFYKLMYGQDDAYSYIPVREYAFINDSVIVNEFTGVEEDLGDRFSFHVADLVYSLAPGSKVRKTTDTSLTITLVDGSDKVISLKEVQMKAAKESILQKKYILGTDLYGRDLLSRLILGTRVSLAVGIMAVIISLLIGISLGAIAGFFGGWLDTAITWLINVIWSLPALLLVIAISFALGKGFWQVFVAVGLSMWVEVARMVRGQIMSVKQTEYVEAGKALGFSNARIILKHILPNIAGPILVVASANFASAILLEAGLSFLGFGAQPPFPSWGSMIKEHYGYIILDSAYLAILPGLAIMLVVYAFNLISVGLRDAFDVKEQQSNV